jgi:hypothetical protein
VGAECQHQQRRRTVRNAGTVVGCMDRACKMHSATMECGDSPSKASAGSSGDGLFFGAGLRPDARLAATAGPSQVRI